MLTVERCVDGMCAMCRRDVCYLLLSEWFMLLKHSFF
jgi:hypothetical protein